MNIRRTKRTTTHFAQIPVKVVKQIVPAEIPPRRASGVDNLIVEPASRKTEPYSTWVVRSATPDPRRMAKLEQLATSLFDPARSTP